jgi:Ca2+:H+ antiporter
MAGMLKREVAVLLGTCAWIASIVAGPPDATSHPIVQVFGFVLLAGLILACTFRVMHHADVLGQRFGEPYDTLILTFSILTIEVSLLASIMLTGSADPTLPRDTMFAGIMLTLNGVVGVVLLVGGVKFGQQEFNLEGARAYLAALTPLAVIALVVPHFANAGDGTLTTTQAIGVSVIVLVFYSIFLAVQTMRHRAFFAQASVINDRTKVSANSRIFEDTEPPMPIAGHFVFLLIPLIVIALLSREVAPIVDYAISRLGAPAAIGGTLVALLSLAPECMSAIRAALEDRLQHSINVFLGGTLATIGLTVPCILVISVFISYPIVLGVKGNDLVLLLLTLFLSSLTFGGVKTNVLQGAVHLLLFSTYVLLIFAP